jgi:arginine decarboxylase
MAKKPVKYFWKLGKEEFNTQYFDVTKKGELMLKEGNYQYNIHELVKKYGTTLEIVFPFIIERRIRDLIDIFTAYMKLNDYRGKFFYHYPMKVNQTKEFVLPMISEGANLETSSANELWIVKRLWEQEKFNAKIRVLCNGPKTQKYLSLIEELDSRGLIITPIIEEESEMEFFRKYKGEVGIRVDLDIKTNSHWDKRHKHFGFQEDELLRLGKIRNLAVLSYHISSQMTRLDDIVGPVRRAVKLYAKMRTKNPQLDTINIGGGGAVIYEKKRPLYNSKSAANRIVKAFKQECARRQVREPNIICEWGRFVVAPAQITIFKVLNEKVVQNGATKKWYIVDGSFISNLPDTWSIHQKWQVVPVNNLDSRRLRSVWLAGSSCDSDDKYTAGGEYILLPRLEEGEDQYIAILDTGAYQDSLANHHCLLSSPAKLVAQDGEIKVARKRETPEEIGKMFGW